MAFNDARCLATDIFKNRSKGSLEAIKFARMFFRSWNFGSVPDELRV